MARIAASDPGQLTPAPSPPQKMPKLVRSSPTANLMVFSGTRSSGDRTAIPATTTSATAAECGRGRECDPGLGCSKRDDDEHDLEPFEQHALECDGERVPVHPGRCPTTHPGRLLALGSERGTLVVQRLVATRAEDRLAQPLQTEHQQQRADDEPECVDREQAKRRTEHRHDHRKNDCRRCQRQSTASANHARRLRQARSSAPRQPPPHWQGTSREREGGRASQRRS